ncbi:hypothetical protein StoSoilB22_41150 [Arthrobacter sp. StoSoilB22]|nr:hypothetical protein StoSoilB22_41150 [Arthrobacter sp. StoSoilB22]
MAAGANEDILRDAAIGTNGDRLKIEDPGIDSDPHVVTDFQLPRPMDFDSMADFYTLPDGGTKSPEDSNPQ